MKNKFLIITIIFFLFSSKNLYSQSKSNEIIFDSNQIEILNGGKIINAKNGKLKIENENIEAIGNEFIYDKSSELLKIKYGTITLIDDDITIKGDLIFYNRVEYSIKASNNVKIKHLDKEFEIYTESIFYNIDKKNLKSKKKTFFFDKEGNRLQALQLEYDLTSGILNLNDVNFFDKVNNEYILNKAYYNTKKKKLIGKDVSVNLNENEIGLPYKLKGSTINHDEDITNLTKGVFTPCKIYDDCPPWQFKAKKISHNKKKKTIYYENAWLELYNKPVFYFPKFFHPDPTVKRQSGFLIPSFVSSKNFGSSFQLPYYHVISDSNDLTFNPRIYSNEKILAQAEYRQIGKNFTHISDASILNIKNDLKNSHFFSKNKKIYEAKYFDLAEINLDIELTSDNLYLREYDIESPISQDYNTLTNKLSYEAFNDKTALNAELLVYKNLNANNNDKYQYVLPAFNLFNRLDFSNNYNGDFYFNSSGSFKNYDTNVYEKTIINDFLYNSKTSINKYFQNNLNFIVKNVNSDSENSKNFKEKTDFKLESLVEFNSTLPLIKENSNYTNLLSPKISIRFNPSKTKNKKTDLRTINSNNIFDINRLSMTDGLEGGESLTYGLNYNLKNNYDKDLLRANIANVLRINKDENISKSSSLGKKTSNVFSSFQIIPNDVINLSYDTAIDENLKDQKYQLLSTDIKINNFITSFEYLNESSEFANESYFANKISYEIDNQNILTFSTRENKKDKITEFYNLIYRYKNDCLEAAIEYNKDYYSYGSIKPEEKLFFSLTIVPFGEAKGPSIYK